MTESLRAIAQRLQITRPIVAIDLETTGTVVGVDRTVQIGVIKARREGDEIVVTEWSTFVDPQLPIPAEVTLRHKITNEMVAGSPTFGDLAGKLYPGLSNCDFIGQNVKFDLRFLEGEFARVGRPWSYADACIIDTKRIDEILSPRTLEALVEKYLKRTITDAHDALADIRQTTEVLAVMLAEFPNLPQTVKGLHALLFPRDPSWVDAAGKVVWRNHEACIGFGGHNGKPLRTMAACTCGVPPGRRHARGCTRGYLEWMVDADFAADIKSLVRDALDGRFPVRAIQEAA